MSSLKDLASLIMIPSLYKDGRLDTVKPLGNSIIHPDVTGNNDGTDGTTPAEGNFTFSRGSNLAATRVDVNGLIEKGRENLLLQSNQFDTTWGTTNASVTGGQSGYDGSSDAWLLNVTGGTCCQQIAQNISVSGVNTFSAYVKKGTKEGCLIYASGSGNPYADFNLAAGSVINKYNGAIDAKIQSVGNDWYRCSVSFTGSINQVRIYVADASGGISQTSGSIYIQDAQVEQGLVATDYIETGASTAQAGILEDMPRLDYSGGASCPALLLEPQRSNLIINSEYFGSYTKSGSITLTHNYGTSPDGLQNSTRMQVPDSSNYYILSNSVSATAGTYVISAYIKGTNGQKVQLYSDGSAGGGGFTECTLTGDWKRFERVVTTTATGTLNPHILFGYGVSPNAQDIEVWGWQCEAGSYPTSYIPTYGSSVTRSRDDMDTTFSSALTSSGSVSVLFDFGAAYISDSNSTTNNLEFVFDNGDRIIYNQNSVSQHRIELNVNGGTEFIYKTFGILRSVPAKICVVVTNKEYRIFVNGQLTSSVGSFTGTADWTAAERFASDINEPIGVTPIKQMLLFPTALTDSEAIALTTL